MDSTNTTEAKLNSIRSRVSTARIMILLLAVYCFCRGGASFFYGLRFIPGSYSPSSVIACIAGAVLLILWLDSFIRPLNSIAWATLMLTVYFAFQLPVIFTASSNLIDPIINFILASIHLTFIYFLARGAFYSWRLRQLEKK
jgi:hypothetical protein